MNKNNFIKLKHIYIGSANYNKHKNIYWLIIMVSYNDSSLQGLWQPLKSNIWYFVTFKLLIYFFAEHNTNNTIL
jgi:hypothetical protein